MCSSAPDTSGQQAAALQQAALSKEQLDWAKSIYAETAPDRADATRRANLVSDAQLGAMADQTALTKDYTDYNKNTFRPLEQGIVADAAGYDTAARRDDAAAKAGASVETNLAAQRGITTRAQQRMGINPGSGKALAIDNQLSIQGAALHAGAENTARTQVETIGAAKKMDAASLGRNLPANQATSAGLALTAGNSAVANGAMSGNINAQGNAIMTGGYAGAQSGLSGAANTYGNIASIQQKAGDNSGLWGALGAVGGAFAGSEAGSAALLAFSDKNLKKNIKPVDPDKALDAVAATPVSNWAYKNGTDASDGGKRHTGPMAQDVQKTMGDKVAPKGKKIDLISMNGIAMAAIQGLNKKVNRVMAMQGLPV